MCFVRLFDHQLTVFDQNGETAVQEMLYAFQKFIRKLYFESYIE